MKTSARAGPAGVLDCGVAAEGPVRPPGRGLGLEAADFRDVSWGGATLTNLTAPLNAKLRKRTETAGAAYMADAVLSALCIRRTASDAANNVNGVVLPVDNG
ncbi:hypothetical protein ACFOZ0_02790 [Streptomyces yaanensis]|uniref:Uncharacterized protein n=1 Tax=Streptomyces yaanensis TaxID=1142239 RepID=A0ABV7S9X5_9ACTN|nr:hypothetical protein [Streptomyces sp. CGMCC 4.7035]WNB99807.1 hypothetical protein Q2K21_18005 [Streptomyces sp. CGMCC 4.7035]